MRPLTQLDLRSYGGISYDTLIESMQIDVLLEAATDNYQGDTWAIVRDCTGRWGMLTYGWGSCSGCDAAEDVNTVEEAIALREALWNQIHWADTVEELHDWLANRDWPTYWMFHEPEFSDKFLPAALALTITTEGH